VPTAFASADELEPSELDGAPVRWPRPSALAAPLKAGHAKAREGADALGLRTVGDLLEHLPRDRRESRTIGALAPGEQATVVVEVRSIRSRPVRRRGMRPLVEATVADGTGVMKVAFFNQPWLVGKYPPGTRLVLHGVFEARNRFRVGSHAPTQEAAGAEEEVARYPATEGQRARTAGPRRRRRARARRRQARAERGRPAELVVAAVGGVTRRRPAAGVAPVVMALSTAAAASCGDATPEGD
jgi:ATP-dependent DNA helicase RecG